MPEMVTHHLILLDSKHAYKCPEDTSLTAGDQKFYHKYSININMLLNHASGAKPNNAITNNDKKTTTKDNFFVSSCP